MIRDEDLLASFKCYGRAPVLDFVARSRSTQDAKQYLQRVRVLEMFRLTSFVTKELISFEKRKLSLWSNGEQSRPSVVMCKTMKDGHRK